ncbi:hypothetical protein DFQ02_10450 [Seonamhaeicola aphaedonensis]|uniref:Uncharacterized protein n=1 Tax=Seonamhaeicola aphaedonensis TaxID=1461338 RepID=A0A3D9HFE3_9FLAO|nr:hypothetical protein DFQ02_10450 [Seonamhaeicola aphaedonensis]
MVNKLHNPHSNFEITTNYKFQLYLPIAVFTIGLGAIIKSIVFNGFELLGFIGLFFLIIGLFLKIFSSKRTLKVSKNTIQFNSKSLLSDFLGSITLNNALLC